MYAYFRIVSRLFAVCFIQIIHKDRRDIAAIIRNKITNTWTAIALSRMRMTEERITIRI